VHWPLLAFAANIHMAAMPGWLAPALLAPAFALAELQFRLVEQPLRRMKLTRGVIALLVAIPLATVGLTFARVQAISSAKQTAERAANVGLSPACDYAHGFAPVPQCRTGPGAQTLLWGDSIAIALVPGFVATAPGGVVQATRTVCGPFLGLAPMNGQQYPRAWAESCIAHNDAVLAYLATHREIHTVVLSGALAALVPGAEDRGWHVLARGDAGTLAEAPQRADLLTASLERTVRAVRDLGRRVVLFAPPPSTAMDPARCTDRMRLKLPTIGAAPDCGFAEADYRALRRPVLDWLADVRTRAIVPVVTLEPALCRNGRCRTSIDGTLLYRDHLHLSTPGARLLGERMGWGPVAERTAS
jgi:hypothetical protein